MYCARIKCVGGPLDGQHINIGSHANEYITRTINLGVMKTHRYIRNDGVFVYDGEMTDD